MVLVFNKQGGVIFIYIYILNRYARGEEDDTLFSLKAQLGIYLATFGFRDTLATLLIHIYTPTYIQHIEVCMRLALISSGNYRRRKSIKSLKQKTVGKYKSEERSIASYTVPSSSSQCAITAYYKQCWMQENYLTDNCIYTYINVHTTCMIHTSTRPSFSS
jgi:hypothetical protein